MVNINLIKSIKNILRLAKLYIYNSNENISRLVKLYIYNSHNIKNYKFIEKNLNQKL